MGNQHYNETSIVRQLISLRYLTETSIKKLIELITKAHISIFKSLAQFFISIRNQLVFADYQFQKQNKNKYLQNNHISQYLKCGRKVVADLANIINEKFKFYSKKYPAPNIQTQPKNNHHQISTCKSKTNNTLENNIQKSLSKLYPEVYWLQKTIREELVFMRKYFQTNYYNYQLKKNEFLKDQLAIKIESKVQQCNTIVNSTFNKQEIYENQSIKFSHDEFYDIKEHTQKLNYQLQQQYDIDPQQNASKRILEEIHNLTPISAKCASCIPYMYKNRTLPRQRCSLMNVQVLNTLDDKRDLRRLKELVQTFMNTKNGGVIFFDTNDLFYSIQPKGFQCSLKVFEQKKQSLIDTCKNLFPDLKINKQFYIDFVLLKDTDIILKRKPSNLNRQTIEIIGRFKILKEKTNSILDQKQEGQKKQVNFPNICTNHYIKRLKNEDLKQLQIEREIKAELSKMKNNGGKTSTKINFSNLKYLQGRQEPIVRHDGNNCKQKPMQIYDDRSQKKQPQLMIHQTKLQKQQQQVQKFHMGKQPLNSLDKIYPYWTLLVMNVGELHKIDSQMKSSTFDSGEGFVVEAPFQDCSFGQSKKTLLIKTTFSHQKFVNIINSPESEHKNYFRTHKKDTGYVPLLHIKVYDSIYVTFSKRMTENQLTTLKQHLEDEVKRYFSKRLNETRNKDENSRLSQWIQQLKVRVSQHSRRSAIWITINDWNPSYGLLYIYYYLKNEASISKQSPFQKIEFKQQKDLPNENGFSLNHKG